MEQIVKKFFSNRGKKYADYWFSCSEKASEKLYGIEYKSFSNYYLLPNAINVERYKFNSIVLGGCNKLTNDGNDKYVCQDNNKNTFTIIAKPDSDIFDFKIEFSNIVL